jgi:hypothetical protein
MSEILILLLINLILCLYYIKYLIIINNEISKIKEYIKYDEFKERIYKFYNKYRKKQLLIYIFYSITLSISFLLILIKFLTL